MDENFKEFAFATSILNILTMRRIWVDADPVTYQKTRQRNQSKKKEKKKNGYKCILWPGKQGDFDAATLIWISNRWPGCICLTFGVLAAIRIAPARCIRKTCGWHDSDFDFEAQRLRDTALNLQKFVKRIYWMFQRRKKRSKQHCCIVVESRKFYLILSHSNVAT